MAQLEEGITQSYREVFGRDPNQDEIDFYVKEFGGDDMYDAGEEQSLEQRLYDSASAARRSIVDQANILADSGERAAELGQQKITDAEEEIKEDIGIDQLVPRNQIIDLYQTELGRDPNEEEIQYYQSYFTKTLSPGIDPFEVRQFRSSPEAVKYRSGFERAFPTLYEDVFRAEPTAQQTAEARERFGDLITPDEVNRFIRDPQTIAQVQSGIRSTLGIPAVTQSGTGPIDFLEFGADPVTERKIVDQIPGPGGKMLQLENGIVIEPTAGIERLRPRDDAGNLIGGTMASTFASPGFTEPDYTKFQQELPDTFKTFSDLVSENIRQDAYRKGLEAAAEVTGQQIVDPTQQAMIQELAESEGNLTPMRAGGLASLYKEGGEVGDAGLANIAQKMASYGRYGDTMLAHISPEEAMMLKAMGGSGTRNPVTGLPEFFLKKLYRGVKRIVKPIYRAIKPFIPYILPPHIGIPLAAADAGFTDGKFDFKKAATAAAKVYAANKVGEVMAGGTPGAPGTGSVSGTGAGGSSYVPASFGTTQSTSAGMLGSGAGGATTVGIGGGSTAGTEGTAGGGSATGGGSTTSGLGGLKDQTVDRLQRIGSGIKARGTEALAGDFSGFEGTAVPSAVFVGASGIEAGMEEAEKLKREQEAIFAKEEDRKKRFRDLASRLGQDFPFRYKEGGISSLPARYLDGEGDGMSDSIKANIGGVQEARLADGEFVVPADVVADLGNGSSNAGAERLYSMMDRIRQARHGTTKQPPEVNVNKTLPA